MKKRLLILDKSWLQGVGREELRSRSSTYRLILTFTLYHEISTASADEKRKCIEKLKSVRRSISALDGLGELLTFEARQGRSCRPLRKRLLVEQIDDLDSFFSSSDRRERAQEVQQLLEVDLVRILREAWPQVTEWFPTLPQLVQGGRKDGLQPILDRVANDKELIREIFSSYREPWMPKPSKINKRWITYRHAQVLLLAAIECVRRYGSSPPRSIPRNLSNLYLDLSYVAIGVLTGYLATHDRQVEEWTRLLGPKTLILR